MKSIIARIFGIVGICVAVSGCQITPVQYAGTPAPEPRCSRIQSRVSIDVFDDTKTLDALEMAAVPPESDPLENKILNAYTLHASQALPQNKEKSVDDRGPISASMLFLSGGSENGAFGAGFLDAWAKARQKAGKPGGLPRFTVITGISTGALQSTFAFLGETGEIVDRYTIEKEGELLHPFVAGGLASKSAFTKLRAGVSLAKRGAVAELQPLREQLKTLISPTRLAAVAREAKAGRLLLVGAVELDSGDAYVFDLTKAATLYDATKDPAMRDCYIEALMASASVPMAALPVFIDGKLFIDGGARFGVIAEFADRAMQRAAKLLQANEQKNNLPSEQKNLFILINGTLEAGQKCNLGDCPVGGPPATPPGVVPQHGKWSFDKLALRSMSVLINQSYRSSVYWATNRAEAQGFVPSLVRIEKDLGAHPYNGKHCDDWRQMDNDLDAPLEFHWRFMRCEIDYGRQRDEVQKWAALE